MLETVAKLAQIFGCIGLWVAYRQYKHSVKLAKINERRSAVELAARLCTHYGSVLMKERGELLKRIDESGCQYLQHCKVEHCKTDGGEDQIKLNSSDVTDDDRQKMKQHELGLICTINALEGFAIPFVTGVADEDVGFMECGHSFVKLFESDFPLYCFSDLRNYYKSSQSLYWRWRKRANREEFKSQYTDAGNQLMCLTEKLVKAESGSPLAIAFVSWIKAKFEQLSKRR